MALLLHAMSATSSSSWRAADILIGPLSMPGAGYTLIPAEQNIMCDPAYKAWKGHQVESRTHRYDQINEITASCLRFSKLL